MPSKAPHSPPYDIPPPEPGQISRALNRRDLWNALEFFRIEALLRSPSVWESYRRASQRVSRRNGNRVPEPKHVDQWIAWYGGKGPVQLKGQACAKVRALLWDGTMSNQFAVVDSWAILVGSHHRHLKLELEEGVTEELDAYDVEQSAYRISEGIVDLSALARTHKQTASLEELQKEQNRFLYLRIDSAIAPTANVKQLRALLEKRHKLETVIVEKPSIDPVTGAQTVPFHPRKDPPVVDIAAWLKYLQCYDLRYQHGQIPDEIATKVYGSNESAGAVETVNQAVSRVKRMIVAAEQNAWPPTNLT